MKGNAFLVSLRLFSDERLDLEHPGRRSWPFSFL